MIRRMKGRYIGTPLLTAILLLSGYSYGQDQTTIQSIVDVLRKGHLSGSLQYRGGCGSEEEHVTQSSLATAAHTSAGPPLQTLREMFAEDKDILVTQEPNGTIRIVDSTLSQDLLNVKIKHLSFDDEAKKEEFFPISPPLILGFITAAPEVKTFMGERSIGWKSTRIIESTTTDTHISGELNNVTLSQALDYMTQTFHGLWIYKECPGNERNKRVVVVWFHRYWQ